MPIGALLLTRFIPVYTLIEPVYGPVDLCDPEGIVITDKAGDD